MGHCPTYLSITLIPEGFVLPFDNQTTNAALCGVVRFFGHEVANNEQQSGRRCSFFREMIQYFDLRAHSTSTLLSASVPSTERKL